MRGPETRPAFDRVRKRDIGEPHGAHVANRGESRLQRACGVTNTSDSSINRQFANRPQDEIALKIRSQMGVQVHQTGQDRDIAQIDNLGRSVYGLTRWPNASDGASLDHKDRR